MYVHYVRISNVRSISRMELKFPEVASGWHVLLGDNGAGKSSVIRSIALGLIGAQDAPALRLDWEDWLKYGEVTGEIVLHLDYDEVVDVVAKKGRRLKNYFLATEHEFKRVSPEDSQLRPASAHMPAGAQGNPITFRLRNLSARPQLERYIWGTGSGWFCCSFGPFRRFTGGNKDQEKIFYSNLRVARHLSAFGEDVALSECLDWLKRLYTQHLDGLGSRRLLDWLAQFLNTSGLLPHGTELVEVNSTDVKFRDGNGADVPIEQLSDGFRSVLSLTFELIRQLVLSYGEDVVLDHCNAKSGIVNLPGIVLIDEVDAHLHPSWQRKIGGWFTQSFPRIQFIVSTHSPLVCQAASNGSIWRLPSPGSGETARRVEGTDLKRLLKGDILDAYSTDLFGADSGRSNLARSSTQRLAELNHKARTEGLTEEEMAEREELRQSLPTVAGIA